MLQRFFPLLIPIALLAGNITASAQGVKCSINGHPTSCGDTPRSAPPPPPPTNATAPAPSAGVDQPSSEEIERGRRERAERERQAELQRQRARRLQRLQEVEKAEQEQRARDRASASREQADFERRKQQSVNQLRMPDGSDGTIHDLKPVPTGQQNADRDTAIKPVPPRRAGPVIRNNPSKEAAAASAAGSAATLHGNDAAKALTGEVFDTAGRRAPANEVDFSRDRPTQKLPPGITASTKYQNLDSAGGHWKQQHQDMEQQLAKVRAEKQKNGANKPQLEVQEANIKDKMGEGSRSRTRQHQENAGFYRRVQGVRLGPKT